MPSPFPNPPPSRRGTLHVLQLDSVALRGNPWGDPHVRDLHVWTPAGHDGSGLPALLFLAPFAGTGESLLGRGLSEVSLASRCARLVEPGCPPFVAVLPDCMTSLGGSQYLDSPGLGDYATYVVDEVVPHVRDRFGVARFGAIGRSSGGYGSLVLAMRHPKIIEAVGCLAGDMGFDLAYLGDLGAAVRGVQAMGGPGAFVAAFWDLQRPGHDAFAALNILAMSCAYSPDPGASPIPARFPVDFDTGAVDFDVLQSWSRHDPIHLVDEHHDALRELAALILDVGDRDEYLLHLGARRLRARLEALGVPHEYTEFRGGHRGTSWRYDEVVPRLVSALATRGG